MEADVRKVAEPVVRLAPVLGEGDCPEPRRRTMALGRGREPGGPLGSAFTG